jgi:hypothetical protein
MAAGAPAGGAALQAQVHALLVPDLQAVAGRLGLLKKGRKAELQDRILDSLGLGAAGLAPTTQWMVDAGAQAVRDVYLQRHGPAALQSLERRLAYSASFAVGGPIRNAAPPAWRPAAPPTAVAAAAAAAAVGMPPTAGLGNTAIRCICHMQHERGRMVQCEVRPAPARLLVSCRVVSAEQQPRLPHP